MRRTKTFIGFMALGIHAAAFAAAGAATQPVSCVTKDSVVLKGRLYLPAQPPVLGWILLHGLGSTKEEWIPLAEKLSERGQAVLLMDLRGHGESTRLEHGEKILYENFNSIGPESHWNAMIGDLEPAVELMVQKTKLERKKIGLGGASLGANIALNFAAPREEVPAVILLSPGVQYAGLSTGNPFKEFAPRPVFMAASPGDAYAYSSVQYLARMRSDPALRVTSGEGAAHGVQMFNEGFLRTLAEWTGSLRLKK